MSQAVYNNAQTNGLLKLEPKPGGMGGILAATGNTLRVEVGSLISKRMTFTGLGTQWSASRVTGYMPRIVTWHWQVKTEGASAESDMNGVELRIEAYIDDGREYILADNKSRSNAYAILTSDSRRVGMRRRTPNTQPAYIQDWLLVFELLWPSTSL